MTVTILINVLTNIYDAIGNFFMAMGNLLTAFIVIPTMAFAFFHKPKHGSFKTNIQVGRKVVCFESHPKEGMTTSIMGADAEEFA